MLTTSVITRIYGALWFVSRKNKAWLSQRVQNNGRGDTLRLKTVVRKMDRQHFSLSFVFENERIIQEFLADDDPALATLQKLVTMVRPFEQRVVVTLDEVAAQAEEESAGRYQRLRGGSEAHRVFGGTMPGEPGNLMGPPLFDGYGRSHLRWCPRGMNESSYAYQYLKALERDNACRQAARRKPQSLIESVPVELTRALEPQALNASLKKGHHLFVPRNSELPTATGKVLNDHLQLDVDETFDLKAFGGITADSYYISDSTFDLPTCCTTSTTKLPARSMPLDVLAASSEERPPRG